MTDPKCAHCPLARDERPCPARSRPHPRYCQLVDPSHPDHNPAYHARIVAAAARTGLPPGFPSPQPAIGRVRVGLLAPCCYRGGAEAVMLAQLRLADPSRVAWRGCAILGGEGATDPGMVEDIRALTPVAFGRAAMVALARNCDVLVSWAIDAPDVVPAGAGRPRVVAVAHSPADSAWAVQHYARTVGVDRWVAVSELALAAIPEAARGEAAVIGNAVDVARLAIRRPWAEMRARWGVPPGSLVAGYLGRLSDEKDPHAMRRLIGHLPPHWHAVLVGGGPEAIDPHPRLHTPGPDPGAGDALNAFDVLVVPSLYESFGLTLAEGLWAGLPVVSTPVGIAAIHPGLTREVPVHADGPTLARVVLDARAWGPSPGARRWARKHLGPDRFGREWTDLICSLAPPAPAPTPGVARQVRLARLRNACPHGSKPEGCGCSDVLKCGDRGGVEVTRAECFDCLEEPQP